MRVIGLDHIVLKCADVEQTLQWYLTTLGLEPVRVEQWRQGIAPFPSVRVDDHTIIDLIGDIDTGEADTIDGRLDHICLVIEATDLDRLAASETFDVVAGPGLRYGARGNGTSLYVRDPDGTVVELRHY